MRGPSDNEAYNGQPDPGAIEPTEAIPEAEIADTFMSMDEALAAEMRGLVPGARTQSDILELIDDLDDGYEMVRLLMVGAATANAHEAATRDGPLSERRTPAFYYMEGVAGLYKVREAMDNRRVIQHMARALNEIGAKVDGEVDDENEAV